MKPTKNRYKEIDLCIPEEVDPLIKIMPEDNLFSITMGYKPLSISGDMIVNGRLITAHIKDCGQFISYLVNFDDGFHYNYTITGVADNIEEAKRVIDIETVSYLMDPV